MRQKNILKDKKRVLFWDFKAQRFFEPLGFKSFFCSFLGVFYRVLRS